MDHQERFCTTDVGILGFKQDSGWPVHGVGKSQEHLADTFDVRLKTVTFKRKM
jgi:hypothetical protein